MKQKTVTITAVTSQAAGFPHGTAAYQPFSHPVSYTYMEQRYQVLPASIFPLPAFCPCQTDTDVILVVANALYLEQGLRLLSLIIRQSQEAGKAIPIVLCVQVCQEQKRHGISIDFDLLEDVLQIPVVPYFHRKTGLDDIKAAIAYARNRRFSYDCLDFSPSRLAFETARCAKNCYGPLEQAVDATFSKPVFGTLFLIAWFLFFLWFTLTGATLLSQTLFESLVLIEEALSDRLAPVCWPLDFLFNGFLPALTCIISIMLPSLAIAFFLFTLLDEAGFLPRISFYGDRLLRPWGVCGSQSLVMSKSAHCHMAGILESRRIQSPRERLAALLTTCLIPCSGRIPTLLAIAALAGTVGFSAAPLPPAIYFVPFIPACFMAVVFLLPGFLAALCTSFLLSRTALKQLSSAFVLELPQLHRPRLITSVIPSAWNHTCLFIGRAGASALLAGFFIWLLSHTSVNGSTLLDQCIRLLEPVGSFLGLDGVIVTAFLLATPANEITMPLMILIYLSQNHTLNASASVPANAIANTAAIFSVRSIAELSDLLALHGWNWHRALSVVILTLFHWPCLPSLQMIHQETKSLKWTATAFLLPSLLGISLCALFHGILLLF